MEILTTAIASNRPDMVKELIRGGILVTPSSVEFLLTHTSHSKNLQIIMKRLELSESALEIQRVSEIGSEPLKTLSNGHAINLNAVLSRLEEKFLELIDLWDADLGKNRQDYA